jgi:ParB/RepB/Spo0J family partition protein
MTKKSEGWISRRGQVGAATAVELVLERQPQEPVQQIADDLIEDSPYQARQTVSDTGVAELAQGMQAAGFQGVLIVRPHGDVARRRQGMFQLVYGHRRRAAWRRVCQERGQPCLLPVVVRAVSDAQLLTIGAQENLQRQDLDPVEEAQIVAWAERMFFDKNQAEIGAMLGKSSDWVSTRSRIHRLPNSLKVALRERPRAVKQMLELASLAIRDLPAAEGLAREVVRNNLTVEALRGHMEQLQPDRGLPDEDREVLHNRRARTTIVPAVTNESMGADSDHVRSEHCPHVPSHAAPLISSATGADRYAGLSQQEKVSAQLTQAATLLQAAAAQATLLVPTAVTMQVLDTAENAFQQIRTVLSEEHSTEGPLSAELPHRAGPAWHQALLAAA